MKNETENVHTIVVNSTSLFSLIENQLRSRRELSSNKSPTNSSSTRFLQTNRENKTNNFDLKGAKLINLTKSVNSTDDKKVALVAPKLSQKSSRFLKQIKDKRKLRNPNQRHSPLVTADTANLTAMASYNHEDWIQYDGSSVQANKEEIPATHDEGTDDGLSEGGPSADDKTNSNESQEPARDEEKQSMLEDQRSNSKVNEINGKSRQQVKMSLLAKKESSSSSANNNANEDDRHEEIVKPIISKSTTTTTTIGDGKKAAKIISKSGTLPPGLRQKIIEQFVKNGGDPQNIVVSDSTITTTSQSKKKTITTVYKIVPNNSKPVEFQQDNDYKSLGKRPVSFMKTGPMPINEKDTDFMGKPSPPTMSFGSLLGNPKKGNFGSGKGPRGNRKMKKILVTRTEEPMDEMMIDKKVNINELGEFYQGPHETIFGVNERPNDFSAEQKGNIMNLDKMVGGGNGAGGSSSHKDQEDHEEDDEKTAKLQMMMKHQQEEEMNDFNDGINYDGKHGMSNGVGGGGNSLNELMKAIEPSAKFKTNQLMKPQHNIGGTKLRPIHSGERDRPATTTTTTGDNNRLLANFRELGAKNSVATKGATSEVSRGKQSGESATGGDNGQAKGVKRENPKDKESTDASVRGERGKHKQQQQQQRSTGELREKRTEPQGEERTSGQKRRDGGGNNGQAKRKPSEGVDKEDVASGAAVRSKQQSKGQTGAQVQNNNNNNQDEKLTGKIRSAARSRAEGSEQQKLDSLEELKRLVLAENNRDGQVKPTTQSQKEAATQSDSAKAKSQSQDRKDAEGIRDRQAAGKPAKSVTVNNNNQKQSAAKFNNSQEAEAASVKLNGAGRGKTHNIMMLIDFSPLQQQQRQPSENWPAKEAQQARAAQQVVQADSKGSSALLAGQQQQQQQQWLPVKAASQQLEPAKSQPAKPTGQPPTVNVQIYNQPALTPSPSDQQQQELLNSDDYGDIEEQFRGQDVYDNAATSQQFRYRLPLLQPALAEQQHQEKSLLNKFNQHLANLMGAKMDQMQGQKLNSLQSEQQATKNVPQLRAGAPILPGESADTNRLVEQVIDELIMEPSNHGQSEVQADGKPHHKYLTTTRVVDSAPGDYDDDDDGDDDGLPQPATVSDNNQQVPFQSAGQAGDLGQLAAFKEESSSNQQQPVTSKLYYRTESSPGDEMLKRSGAQS